MSPFFKPRYHFKRNKCWLNFAVAQSEVCVTPLHLYRMDFAMRETADLMGWIVTGFWFLDIPVSWIDEHLSCFLRIFMCLDFEFMFFPVA